MTVKITSLQFSSTWKLVRLPPGIFQCSFFVQYSTNDGPDYQLTSIMLVWLLKVMYKHFNLTMVIRSLSWLRLKIPSILIITWISRIYFLWWNKCCINSKASKGCKGYTDIKKDISSHGSWGWSIYLSASLTVLQTILGFFK